MVKLNGDHLKLAIQKDGRLTEDTRNLLRTVGLQFDAYKQRLFSNCRNFPMDILFVRDDDIPEYVAEGVVDLGIVGRNLMVEAEKNVQELMPLNYGQCTLMVAVPADSGISDVKQLAGCKVATSYPNSTQRFFAERDIPVNVIPISGSVEITPALGVAAAIVDLVSTGSSLKLNDLVAIDTVLESQSIIIANPNSLSNTHKSSIIERLLTRFRGVLSAAEYKYVMMNVPSHELDYVSNLMPGLKSPTVLPTADPEWMAVHTAIREDVFWEAIEELKRRGAQGILVSSIEKMFV
ncbi:ATP phosphoribosyltransferase [Tengunoibacter tsumagoiensis]|uniref:ATP phosphoribosyltransferase n=1 Tax=Tengunoibacter tsumagoiensis TaxID=2014871 RepID=A0A401ZX79_9CHLR|nr:ATP phosphoribosyltransferase [Tengunoibacter tsumagoiensis]GCE11447.1 ATP phosphoribosyltransferase [Tengunoibacter tsumagoiensis]